MPDSKITYKSYMLMVTVKLSSLKDSYILDEESVLPENPIIYQGICSRVSFELEVSDLKVLGKKFREAVHKHLKQISQKEIEQIKLRVEGYECSVRQQQRLYRAYLEEKGFSFTNRYLDYEGVTEWYAVYSPYLQEFDRRELSKIPDWAMIPISKELFEIE